MPVDNGGTHSAGLDDNDGFAPIRINSAATQAADATQKNNGTYADRCVTDSCMTFLALVPILQGSSGESTRDKELTEMVLNCSGDRFLLISSIYFGQIRKRYLHISLSVLDRFLEKLGAMLETYEYARSEQLQLLVTQFLNSTLHHWKEDIIANSDTAENISTLCRWLSSILKAGKIKSWKTRDCVARFMHSYILEDSGQKIWSMIPSDEDSDPGSLPTNLLPMLGADQDIRVRFRVAYTNASLFSVARETGHDPTQLYAELKGWLTNDIDK